MDGALNGQTVRSFEGPEGNQYEQLKVLREEERLSAIKQGLIDDPNHPKALEEAKLFLGTCTDMCPRFEREQREYQNNVERWELDPATGRIDARRAVKAFHRPAAGNEQALPSDVRPPHVLISTLDYLFDDIMCGGYPLEVTHGFIRDRTRSIRQDFTLQNNRGSEAILCHERIARFHILSLHLMRNVTGFSEQQETEQLRKTLQSLAEYYSEQRHLGMVSPFEAEFRGYHVLTRIRDPDVLRQVETLPLEIQASRPMEQALRLYNLAQRSNEDLGRFKAPNCEGSQNLYARFFKLVGSQDISYLFACLCETQFTEVRRGAVKAMRKAYMPQQAGLVLEDLAQILGFDHAEEARTFLEHFGFATITDSNGKGRVELNKNTVFDESDVFTHQPMSMRLVEVKRNSKPLNIITRGESINAAKSPLQRSSIGQGVKPQAPISPAQLPLIEAQPALQKTPAQPSLVKHLPFGHTGPGSSQHHGAEREIRQVTEKSQLSMASSTIEAALRSLSRLMFQQMMRLHLAENVRKLVEERAAKNRERHSMLNAAAKELCDGLVRNQLAVIIREAAADARQRKALLIKVFARFNTKLHAKRQQRRAAEEQLIQKRRHQAAYAEAFSNLQNLPPRSLKRPHSALLGHEAPAAPEILRIKCLAERFWQEWQPGDRWCEMATQYRTYPWTLFTLVNDTDSPSSRWLSTKFAQFSSKEKNLAYQQSAGLPARPIEHLAAVLFECTSDWKRSAQRLVSLLQAIAATSRIKCLLVIVCFEAMESAQVAQQLKLQNILADPRSPALSAWFICMASMDQVDDFHNVLDRALGTASYCPTADEQERHYISEQQRRAQEGEISKPKRCTHPSRSSFYDTRLLPLQPSKVIDAMAIETYPKRSTQQSALMKAIDEAKQTLSWSKDIL